MAEINAFVCGHPINHSRSPLIHNHWIQKYGLRGAYQAIDIAPEEFSAFISDLKLSGFAGGNITIPHKEKAFGLAARKTEVAELIGAANTLWFEDGELWATNTDAHGFAANLDALVPGWDQGGEALVIGAGGASRAIIHALLERGFSSVRLANRTIARARELADRFGPRVSAHALDELNDLAPHCAIAVNTTSLGMKGEGEVPMDMTRLPPHALATDIVYVPIETPFLKAARFAGLKTADGLGMLLHQAAPGFEKWFGVLPEVTQELRAIIEADLGLKA